jgi:hypothetical protein
MRIVLRSSTVYSGRNGISATVPRSARSPRRAAFPYLITVSSNDTLPFQLLGDAVL